MSERECDHCDEAVAELMSLVDHEFTGDEVRALNAHIAGLRDAELQRLLASHVEQVKQATARAEVAEQMLAGVLDGLGDWAEALEGAADDMSDSPARHTVTKLAEKMRELVEAAK